MVGDFNILKETEETLIREVSYRKFFALMVHRSAAKDQLTFLGLLVCLGYFKIQQASRF